MKHACILNGQSRRLRTTATLAFFGSGLWPHTSHTICPALRLLQVSMSTRMAFTCPLQAGGHLVHEHSVPTCIARTVQIATPTCYIRRPSTSSSALSCAMHDQADKYTSGETVVCGRCDQKVACMHACNLQLIFLVALYVSAAAVQNPTLKADGQATAKTASGSCNGGCAKSNTPR